MLAPLAVPKSAVLVLPDQAISVVAVLAGQFCAMVYRPPSGSTRYVLTGPPPEPGWPGENSVSTQPAPTRDQGTAERGPVLPAPSIRTGAGPVEPELAAGPDAGELWPRPKAR